ncbi:galactose-1-epimerase [Vibrio sp. 99-8-1]|uniref:galactose-1-epimerase n=1 Tax=Vibrio sp. 99-8-1 TaxID=2607602 RepID=UPI001493991D|nr:galactose-1-epimerase [Vibrio sp. 99-8-1]NOI64880.1 galactose-1-epimerase [Vibrio sp. 99-8-1]
MEQEAAFDGQPARLIRLENSVGMSATFMDIGATWLSCTLPVNNLDREVLLGTSTMADFEKMSAYMGVTVGRYANRIAKGQFSIDGQPYQLEVNQAGNTLHGGVTGFDAYRWAVEKQAADFVQFSLFSEDGDQGFPGNVTCSVRYTLTDDNEVVIQYLANTDKATPVNLTNHAYFNLMGEESGVECTSYSLQINAQHYLPTDNVGIPLGDLMPVEGTSFDFQQLKTVNSDFLADEQQKNAQGYDHSFYLNSSCYKGDCAAVVTTEDSSVTMKVFTDKPAIQLYTGNWLAGEPNKNGGRYQNYAGIALETQFLPDSPNHPEWQQQSCILLPEQEYRFKTIYQFEFEK